MNRKSRIEETLTLALSPLHVEVLDESHMHSVPPGAESHFKVVVVSEVFNGTTLVARHRRLNSLLTEEFQTGLHAMAIHAWTPEEWYAKGGLAPASPPCMSSPKAGARGDPKTGGH
jgi:BolA family transcriptional regulator, general stress-responsive regulator